MYVQYSITLLYYIKWIAPYEYDNRQKNIGLIRAYMPKNATGNLAQMDKGLSAQAPQTDSVP